jgi:hypothetical protein
MFEEPPLDIGNIKMLEGRTTENETMMTFDALGFYAMMAFRVNDSRLVSQHCDSSWAQSQLS